MNETQRLCFEKLKATWQRLQQAFLSAQLEGNKDTWGPASGEVCHALRSLNAEFCQAGRARESVDQVLYALSLRLLTIRGPMHEAVVYGADMEDVIFILHEEIEERIAAIEGGDYILRWEA